MFNRQETADRPYQQSQSQYRGCGRFGKKFGSILGDALEDKTQWRNAFNGGFGNRKAANIEETGNTFIISLYAAGLQKKDFNISVTGDVLTIKYTAAGESSQQQYAHLEYEPGSFQRSFQLNGKVITDSISATYIDGVLKVTLPKNPETNKPAQQVNVD